MCWLLLGAPFISIGFYSPEHVRLDIDTRLQVTSPQEVCEAYHRRQASSYRYCRHPDEPYRRYPDDPYRRHLDDTYHRHPDDLYRPHPGDPKR
ncbi:hypothetical protein CKO25_07730 [Thiocapsa imhoffii]|uniref:Uncharacterized protein n=1 Tax=Thiocapsa imhoffii TaxID=382777 RepID=A0A9X0WHS8_9GAMM|nr:hypothetical protein [Thiocapsa imhoffii]MBK1644544.1 hypothetical protein [Thiocapsa imhoffii]